MDRGSVRRINTLAHPAGFINDFGTQNGWISAAGEREVNITVVLTDSLYEVRLCLALSLSLSLWLNYFSYLMNEILLSLPFLS